MNVNDWLGDAEDRFSKFPPLPMTVWDELDKAVAALRAALRKHQAYRIYHDEARCLNWSEKHMEERHTDSEEGGMICLDKPTGEAYCESCRDTDGSPMEWPCATVQAITEKLEET